MADDVQELRQLFADDTAEWQAIREEGATDMRHVAGDPWDPKDREQRRKSGRPCLALDELSQYTNQVVNEVRANKRAVKFAPVGNGANDKSAEFYADKMREIEYRSRAQIAYTTAFGDAVQRSYGFCRVSTRYEHSRSVNQDIWIDPVHNPDLITPDPYALMPDLSDMKHCWVREPWLIEDFNRRWPKQKLAGKAHTDMAREAPLWISNRQVWVSEHWKIKTTRRKLLIVQKAAPQQPGSVLGLRQAPPSDPVGIFEDELDGQPVPGDVLTTRDVDDPSVYQCLTNGVDILEENPWLGKYIPIVACLGKVIYLDEGAGSKRKILSLIRLARDPYMLYCYYRTCEAELVGMTPKFPYFARKGSLNAANLLALQQSLHEPVAVIEVENQVEGRLAQDPPEFPMRQPYDPPIQALEVGAESARRAIQAAIGQSPLPTSAQRRNEKSGVALKHIEETGQRGSFHFTDHYLDMIQHVGVVVEDLMDKIYDTVREVGIRKANDSAEIIRINGGDGKQAVSTKGDHLVTVSTGPSFDSEREAASDFADLLVGTPAAPMIMDLAIKLKNLGPLGDEMAERVTPPEFRKPKDGEEPTPQMLQQQLAETNGKMKELEQVAQQMKQALDTDQAKQQATIQKAQIDADAAVAMAQMREQTTIAVAKLSNLVKPSQQAEADAIEAELQRRFDAIMLEREHEHEMELAQLKAQQAERAAERQHEHALESGDQQVAGKLAVEASRPQPENGASA